MDTQDSYSKLNQYNIEDLTLTDINRLIDKGKRFTLKSKYDITTVREEVQDECGNN